MTNSVCHDRYSAMTCTRRSDILKGIDIFWICLFAVFLLSSILSFLLPQHVRFAMPWLYSGQLSIWRFQMPTSQRIYWSFRDTPALESFGSSRLPWYRMHTFHHHRPKTFSAFMVKNFICVIIFESILIMLNDKDRHSG